MERNKHRTINDFANMWTQSIEKGGILDTFIIPHSSGYTFSDLLIAYVDRFDESKYTYSLIGVCKSIDEELMYKGLFEYQYQVRFFREKKGEKE